VWFTHGFGPSCHVGFDILGRDTCSPVLGYRFLCCLGLHENLKGAFSCWLRLGFVVWLAIQVPSGLLWVLAFRHVGRASGLCSVPLFVSALSFGCGDSPS
jgi:hypothetical protein